MTWYARTDGGTTVQCTGLTNAPYPGSGTGQACAYASLQDALNAAATANVEATIIAQAGNTWNQITLPVRAASTAYITVQSSNVDNISAQLHGVTNADVINMATIATTVDNFAISIPSGRAYWNFKGFQVTTANRSQYYTILIDHAGDHVNFDSCWIHSLEDYTDNPEASCRIGMSYRGTNSAFTNCRMAYFSAYALGTQIVDNNFAIAYAGSTLSVSNSFLGAWFEALISGGSSFAPAVDGVTLSGTPTLTSATLSSVSGLAINDLIALRNYAPRTLTNACSFVAATRTLTCTGGNFTAAYVDIGGGGSPRFQFTSLGIGGTVASVTNSTTAIMTSDLGGNNFSGQTVSIEGVYGAAKVSNIVGNVVTYAPYGITALQAAPEVPGNAQWGGFVPNNLTFTQCMFYNNPVIAGTVRAQVGASPKAFWEIKGIDTFTVTGCEFTGTGTNLGYLVANQGTPSGCPSVWTTITGVNFSSNYYHTDTNQFQIMGLSLANDYYCTSMGGGDITIANNLFTSGAVLSRLISGTNVAFSHNTVINADGGGAQLIQQEAGDSSDDTLGFNYSDNIAFNNFYGLHCSYDGTLGCFPSNVISTNLFIGTYTTDPWCQHGFSPGNVCVVDETAVGFLDPAANNYRLANNSPGKGTGTGGSDMGVDWDVLVAALGFDPSGGTSAVVLSGRVVASGQVVIGGALAPPAPEFVIEGFGANTIGGSGGTVYTVTNLNDSGAGSLRSLINLPGPRIIQFAVSGTINLLSILAVTQPFLTIDGSTAPSPGIAIRGYEFDINIHEVIIRYVRFRGVDVAGHDNISITGIDFDLPNPKIPYNIVLDHISCSWGQDGSIDIVNQAHDITIQNSIIASNLASGLMLISYSATNISVHHNLFAHGIRIPELAGGNVDWVNNAMYNWQGWGRTLVFPLRQPIFQNIVNNFYKAGPSSQTNLGAEIRTLGDQPYTNQSSLYVNGNLGPHRPNNALPQLDIVTQDNGPWPSFAASRFNFPPITTVLATEAYTNILAAAGAVLPCRDTVDAAIVTSVVNGTGAPPVTSGVTCS